MTTDRVELDCGRARERISACYDGEDAADAALREHVERCADCRDFESGCARVTRSFDLLRGSTPPAELARRILASARTPAPRVVRAEPIWLRVAAGLVGLVAIGGLGRFADARRCEPHPTAAGWLEPLGGRALHPADGHVLAWAPPRSDGRDGTDESEVRR